MAKKIKLRDKSANQLIPITRSTAVEMNDGVTLQTAYEGINSSHYTKAEINEMGYLQNYTEYDPTVPSYVKGITQIDITYWNNKLDSFTETDPIYSASVAAGITSTDISNWNSKTDNVGTITGITMNNTSKGTSGVVDLGTVLTEHQSLSSYITSGYFNTEYNDDEVSLIITYNYPDSYYEYDVSVYVNGEWYYYDNVFALSPAQEQ